MNLSKKTLKISVVLLTLALLATIAISAIMITKQIDVSFRLKASYGLLLMKEDNVTELTAINWLFNAQDEIQNLNCYVTNVGSGKVTISWNCTGMTWTTENGGMYKTEDYDLSLQYYNPDHALFLSEHSSTPDHIEIDAGATMRLYFGAKCYTNNSDHILTGVQVFINSNTI